VAEYNFTGIATSPNVIVSDAMERAAMIVSACRYKSLNKPWHLHPA
jgi:hypothetical protein